MKLQRLDQTTVWIILGIIGFAWRSYAATLTLNESSTLKGPEWAELETKEYANPATPYSTRRILQPKPLTSLEGLKKLNPEIDQALPAITELLKDAKVSERFAEMYHRKVLHIEGGHPLSAEDYFDCATILETTARGQKVILWQSRMDVDTDGSDPNRLSALEDYDPSLKDPWFQPLLSYKWIQKPATENPFLPRLRSTVTALEKIHAALGSVPKPTEQIKKFDEKVVTALKDAAEDCGELDRKVSPLAEYDPFIVVPVSWKDVPSGTLAAVVVGSRVYPCIVGDKGSAYKTGEASLKIAKEVSDKSSGSVAALSTLGATYIVFPGAKVEGRPDYQKITGEVIALMAKTFDAADESKFRKW